MLSLLKKYLINTLGWRTGRKIVVFESDDWGSIRMSSNKALERLRSKGYPVDKCAYSSNDSLEGNEDVEALLDVLGGVKNKMDVHPKFTLNNVVANPDFDRIRENKFEKYFFEPFTKSLGNYSQSGQVMKLYRQGLEDQLIQMQLHCREHINVNRWMEALQRGDKRFMEAFSQRCLTIPSMEGPGGRKDFLDTLGMAYSNELESPGKALIEAAGLFEKIWGFRSQSFIAPCYVWDSSIEHVLKEIGIKYLQGTHVQRVPAPGLELKMTKKYHYTGQRNALGQVYFIRNVMFEPTETRNPDVVNDALKEIAIAFRLRRPAIVSSHRVNFIGRINEENRSKNLKLLKELLRKIISYYPEVEFMSSDELGLEISRAS